MILCEDVLDEKVGRKFQTVVENTFTDSHRISTIKTLNEKGEILAEHEIRQQFD